MKKDNIQIGDVLKIYDPDDSPYHHKVVICVSIYVHSASNTYGCIMQLESPNKIFYFLKHELDHVSCINE